MMASAGTLLPALQAAMCGAVALLQSGMPSVQGQYFGKNQPMRMFQSRFKQVKSLCLLPALSKAGAVQCWAVFVWPLPESRGKILLPGSCQEPKYPGDAIAISAHCSSFTGKMKTPRTHAVAQISESMVSSQVKILGVLHYVTYSR